MTIPDYQTLMLPLLRLVAAGHVSAKREAIEALADEFNLTAEERSALLPSGREPIFANRVGWAATYLRKAGLLVSHEKGKLAITARGKEVLAKGPETLGVRDLLQFPEFARFRNASLGLAREKEEKNVSLSQECSTPSEIFETAYKMLRAALAEELLDLIQSRSPAFFERLVLDLLVKMGYGGSRQEAACHLGRSGDGGVDGVINEDRLGLDAIYIQAKRWQGVVGRPEIQKFVGALHGRRAKKGIFITASSFSQEAIEYASHIEPRVALIDGRTLVELMIDYDIGVTIDPGFYNYIVKRVDLDYFSEE